MNPKQKYLQSIYKVDEVLLDERLIFLRETVPHTLIVETIREEIQKLRQEILNQDEVPETLNHKELFIEQILTAIHQKTVPSLHRIINATGTVLHTNLGRANLPYDIGKKVLDIACHYSTLEYNVKAGKRGSSI